MNHLSGFLGVWLGGPFTFKVKQKGRLQSALTLYVSIMSLMAHPPHLLSWHLRWWETIVKKKKWHIRVSGWLIQIPADTDDGPEFTMKLILRFTFRSQQWKRRKTSLFFPQGILCMVYSCVSHLTPWGTKLSHVTLSSFEIYQPVKVRLSAALYTFHKGGIHGGPCHHLFFTTAPALMLCTWAKNNHRGEKYKKKRIRQKCCF